MFMIGNKKRFLAALIIGVIAIALLPEKFAQAEDRDGGDAFAANDARQNGEPAFPNPAALTLTLEYAFFDGGGTFRGGYRHALDPAGTVRRAVRGKNAGVRLPVALRFA